MYPCHGRTCRPTHTIHKLVFNPDPRKTMPAMGSYVTWLGTPDSTYQR